MLDQKNMFLSLHQPVTKYQTLNVRQSFLFLPQLEKRIDSLASSLFELQQQEQTAASIWLLVIG